MKEVVTVSAVQFEPAWLAPEVNAERMSQFIDQAVKAQPVDLVVFPELSNLGYITGRDKAFSQRYMNLAEPLDGLTTRMLGRKCREHNLYTIVGMALRDPGLPGAIYNSAVLIGPKGTVEGVYNKTHIAAEEKHYFVPGDDLPVFSTAIGNLGVMICYDTLFPEVARVMTLKGADILIAIFNSPLMDIYLHERYAHLASVRAWENKNFVICCNRVGEQAGWKWLGHSAIASAAGKVLAYSNTDGEEIISAQFEAKQIVEERAYLTTFRDRRPDLYHELTRPLTDGIAKQLMQLQSSAIQETEVG